MTLDTMTRDDRMTKTDRCMCGCPAQALVRVQIPMDDTDDLTVDYCAHHWGKHETGLDHLGVTILIDVRDEASTAVDSSAAAGQ